MRRSAINLKPSRKLRRIRPLKRLQRHTVYILTPYPRKPDTLRALKKILRSTGILYRSSMSVTDSEYRQVSILSHSLTLLIGGAEYLTLLNWLVKRRFKDYRHTVSITKLKWLAKNQSLISELSKNLKKMTENQSREDR